MILFSMELNLWICSDLEESTGKLQPVPICVQVQQSWLERGPTISFARFEKNPSLM
ncbi:hypothetical protein QG37_05007 [Candidozyma auris]|uniref:Uncharacterized protein n=1 Tax=Candidozyma auris TaxID=498019 RepID=A0A0L0NVQ2_CANAR|nr:hypothetical protein QG37_05007 [[Candida] auris]